MRLSIFVPLALVILGIFLGAALTFPRAQARSANKPERTVFIGYIRDHFDRCVYMIRVDDREYIVNEQGGIIEHHQ